MLSRALPQPLPRGLRRRAVDLRRHPALIPIKREFFEAVQQTIEPIEQLTLPMVRFQQLATGSFPAADIGGRQHRIDDQHRQQTRRRDAEQVDADHYQQQQRLRDRDQNHRSLDDHTRVFRQGRIATDLTMRLDKAQIAAPDLVGQSHPQPVQRPIDGRHRTGACIVLRQQINSKGDEV